MQSISAPSSNQERGQKIASPGRGMEKMPPNSKAVASLVARKFRAPPLTTFYHCKRIDYLNKLSFRSWMGEKNADVN